MMLDQLDDQLRAGAQELRAQISGEPPALPPVSRRPKASLAAALLLVGAIGAAWVVNQRDATGPGDRATVASSYSVTDTVPEGTPATSTAAATHIPPASRTPPANSSHGDAFRRVDENTLMYWIGTWTIDFQPADIFLGTTGDVDYSLEMTEASFCIHGSGSVCEYTDDGSPLSEQPRAGGISGSSGQPWTAAMVAPVGVELQFYIDGGAACEMHAFPMTSYGDAVLWACENTTPFPATMEVAATRGALTVIATVDWVGTGFAPDSSANSTSLTSAAGHEIASLPWPTDPWSATSLEQLIDVDPQRSIDIYVERRESLTRICMADAASVNDVPLNPEDATTATGATTDSGLETSDGCEGWATNLAFPGNHFADSYETLRIEAANRSEFITVLDLYRECLSAQGFDEGPEFDGLDADAAQKLTDQFNDAAGRCDQSVGLKDAQRAVDVLAQQALTLADPDAVRTYAANLTNALGSARPETK